MARRIVWTEPALADVEAAADYIAKDSPHYGAMMVRQALDAAHSLRHSPERGRTVPEFANPSVRELLVGRFRLIYRVGGDVVHVLAFIHGARDLHTAWKGRT